MRDSGMTRDRQGLLARCRRAAKGLMISSPGRDAWQRPDEVIAALVIRPGERIADPGGPTLPERIDLAFLCNVYHHLPDQRAYFARLAPQLAPGARVAIVE